MSCPKMVPQHNLKHPILPAQLAIAANMRYSSDSYSLTSHPSAATHIKLEPFLQDVKEKRATLQMITEKLTTHVEQVLASSNPNCSSS